MSLRELCRRHGVTAHSAVVVQARRATGRRSARSSELGRARRAIARLAQGAADREAEVRDAALEAIDEAITRFRADLRATEQKLIDGERVEVPVMQITPRDLALFIDRMNTLFGRPAMISEGRGFSASVSAGPLPLEALQRIVEVARGVAPPPEEHTSGLPHIREKRPD